MFEPKKVFVTGGSGYLGRNLIRTLVSESIEVIALVRSDNAKDQVESLGAQPHFGNLLEDLSSGMKGCDTVVHCAALAEDWGKREAFYKVNVEGTENVLDSAKKAGIKCFVHISTEAIFANGKPILNADESWPIPDDQVGLYPWSKALAEKLVMKSNSESMRVVAVRPRFIWGRDDTTLLPKLIKLVQDKQFAWIDSGHYLTSTCHVDNVCEGILLAIKKGAGGSAYFLTDGSPIDFREFLTKLFNSKEIDPGKKTVPKWLILAIAYLSEWTWKLLGLSGAPPVTVTGVRLGGESVTVVDKKARTELGYQARKTVDEGVKEMVNFL